MKITKVINNNIVVSRDDSQREVVLMGKGLGFQKHAGQTIDPKKIEDIYHEGSWDDAPVSGDGRQYTD